MIKKQFILAVMLAFLMIFAVTSGCFETEKESDEIEEPSVILTVVFEDYQANYTLEDLEEFEAYTGSGSYIRLGRLPNISISDMEEYTGVQVTTLLNEIPDLPENYTISVIDDEGETVNFTKNETLGYVDFYNETGDIISNDTAVMILAYKENGSYYSDFDPENEIGPLRVAFVDGDVITSSSLWTKRVVSIDVLSN